MQLSRPTIAQSAVGILDKYGLADVSMRRVAASLNVAPGALYWHVDNKQELICAMAEIIIAPVLERSYTGPREVCAALRAAVLSHRDGADVVATAAALPGADIYAHLLDAVKATLNDVRTANTANDGLIDATAAGLLYLTLGAANMHQSGVQFNEAARQSSALTAPRGTEAHVEQAINLLLAGLDAQ
nr:Tetracycline repressor protein class E [Streptococcus thermophilus]